MTSEKIQRVGVIGAGIMGAGIAEVCARAHVDVLVFEQTRELAAAGRARILRSLDRGVSSGKITEREREQAAWRLRFTSDLGDFADRQLVVEAVVEDEKVKSEIFAELDKIVTDPNAVLASNTSSIPIMKLGIATSAPERVIGLHFFNPVPVLPLVELITTLKTSPTVTERAEAFAADVLGKQVVRSSDRAGFIANALLVPYLLSAIRMVESGFATKEDVDKAAKRLLDPNASRCLQPIWWGSIPSSRSPTRCTGSSRSRCTRRRRCCSVWSRPVSSARSRAQASTNTPKTVVPPKRQAKQ